MPRVIPLSLTALTLLLATSTAAADSETDRLSQQVKATERAFAATMADRDHAAFVNFLSEETVFFAGESALRGKQQVADTWKAYFEEPDAPFSWEPQTVEVLDSGTLALSTGPVRNSSGELYAYFTSIWRLEENGEWKIIFDKGNRACDELEAED